MPMSTTYRLFAGLNDDDTTLVTNGTVYHDWAEAQRDWYRHDDARRADKRDHVLFYAVRESDHPWTLEASTDQTAFEDYAEIPQNVLTDREYAEVMRFRSSATTPVRRGASPRTSSAALAKLTNGCTPSTDGLTFSLVQR